MLKIVRACAAAALLLTVFLCGCGDSAADSRGIHLAAGGRVKTLDPALAEDLASRNMCAALYDTLLEYEYPGRPYRLRPAMLETMPEWSADGKVLHCRLRDDLSFPADPCFGGKSRKITSRDVLYTIRRLANGQLHSPAYWMVRGKITGLDEYRRQSAADPLYDAPVAGLEYLDDRNFAIHLTAPDPRFLYILALPNLGIVPQEAVEFYKEGFAEHPVGSGPFQLREWVRDYKLHLTANAHFRTQYFAGAQNPADRQRKLPLAESIVCYQVRQPFAAWLLFLQGELDASVLDKDNLDLVTGGTEIAPALQERGVELLRAPEFEIVYTGFNCQDPKLQNPKLRKAIAMAFNTDARVLHLNHLLQKIDGPIPDGVDGFDETLQNPWQKQDPAAAAALLAEAGYPGGIDPATGEPLPLTFDLGNSTSAQRQLGELLHADLAKIGIRVQVSLNSAPRFIEKIRQGRTQLFRYSWIGDYPDAENFLQLFYSGNIGGCNRAAFSDPEFDRMYERAVVMPDSPERTALYRQMAEKIVQDAPWIFEGRPISFQLKYDWLENYHPHDFAFCRWKYLAVRHGERAERKRQFHALDFSEMAGK